jgi:hypothetical protein
MSLPERTAQWIKRNLFLLSLFVLAILYLWWQVLAPFVAGDDATVAFIAGMVVLAPFAVLACLSRLAQTPWLKILLNVANTLLLVLNLAYVGIHLPQLNTFAVCSGNTYLISYGRPLGDEQWTYTQYTRWSGWLQYRSGFFGYSRPYTIVCDEAQSEANFINMFGGIEYTYGPQPRHYATSSPAQLGDHLYFMSEALAAPAACSSSSCWSSASYLYTLYECGLDYRACHALPVSYITRGLATFELTGNEASRRVSVVESGPGVGPGTLIFSYGRNPYCYVEACTIGIRR